MTHSAYSESVHWCWVRGARMSWGALLICHWHQYKAPASQSVDIAVTKWCQFKFPRNHFQFWNSTSGPTIRTRNGMPNMLTPAIMAFRRSIKAFFSHDFAPSDSKMAAKSTSVLTANFHFFHPVSNKETRFYTVSQKQDTKLLPITSPYINRFSNFFHWWTQ